MTAKKKELLIKAWSIRKIATQGIVEREGVFSDSDPSPEKPKYLRAFGNNGRLDAPYFFERIGTDIFLTREEAVTAGLSRLSKKINALGKQKLRLLKKFEALCK